MKAFAALAAFALLVPAPALADANAEIDALTLRVQKLEGVRAVKNLQRAFGYYVDRGLWGEAADLFAEDGTIEIGLDGVYQGKGRIREYLKRLHGGMSRADHLPAGIPKNVSKIQSGQWIILTDENTQTRGGS